MGQCYTTCCQTQDKNGNNSSKTCQPYKGMPKKYNRNQTRTIDMVKGSTFAFTNAKDVTAAASLLLGSDAPPQTEFQAHFDTVISGYYPHFNQSTIKMPQSILEGSDQAYKVSTIMLDSANLSQIKRARLSKKGQEECTERNNFDMIEEIKKRNNKYFIKDYGKNDYSQFFFNESGRPPKITLLHQQREFIEDLALSNQEKIAKIQTRLNYLTNPQQSLIIGNQEKNIDFGVDLSQYEKLVIEVKYASFEQPLGRKQKPIVIIGQPIICIPEQIQNIQNGAKIYNNILPIDQSYYSEIQGGRKTTYAQQMAKPRHMKRNSQAPENTQTKEILKSQKPGNQQQDNNKSIVKKSAILKNFLQSLNPIEYLNENNNKDVTLQYDQNSQINKLLLSSTNKKHNKLNDSQLCKQDSKVSILEESKFKQSKDEYLFETKATFLEEQKKKSLFEGKKRKKAESEKMIVPLSEAFILYYDKNLSSRDNKAFSIQLQINTNDKNGILNVGKKQNFLLYQFSNGQIYEKEIILGSSNDSYLISSQESIGKSSSNQCKLSIRVQYIKDEQEKLVEALDQLCLRQNQLGQHLQKVDELMQEAIDRQAKRIHRNQQHMQPHQKSQYLNYIDSAQNKPYQSPMNQLEKQGFEYSTAAKPMLKLQQMNYDTPQSKLQTTTTHKRTRRGTRNMSPSTYQKSLLAFEEQSSKVGSSYHVIGEEESSEYHNSQRAKYYHGQIKFLPNQNPQNSRESKTLEDDIVNTYSCQQYLDNDDDTLRQVHMSRLDQISDRVDTFPDQEYNTESRQTEE
ncbi:UNKNOWN [Stylonychia lemnae]|uniref:Uncharacterized protein n=1 Tax=Stylonychia lemnae TaxID=5949 RepID=A0A078A1L0_STYLE|nr:UNKNOWN [Stylonychia lemnae]|eukprot:CDW76146.1 UNKNOWN [Stylonychia lemnae]